MDQKVLVTGASGLIGRELCNQLTKQGYTVSAVDNGFRSTYIPNCDVFECIDITNYTINSKNNFDYIFHMGNINGTKYFYDIPNDLLQSNIEADFAIFNFAQKNPSCKLIYASSSEVVAGTNIYPTTEQIDINIKDMHNPRWSYRLGKMVGENYLTNSNIDYLIVRFFNVYSENSFSGHFVRDILEKLNQNNYNLPGANETRSFCHVSDAVDAVINIRDVSNDIINVGSDEEITILDAANIIADELGMYNIPWTIKDGLAGSVKRRNPDISMLKKHYPGFSPKLFRSCIKQLFRTMA